MQRRRVAITGVGLVCPWGHVLTHVWARALAGESVIAPFVAKNAATGTTLTVPAATVPESSIRRLPKVIELMTDKFGRLALLAAEDAISAAGLDFTTEDSSRIGTSTGTCMSGITETEVGFNSLYVQKRAKVHPFTVVRTMANAPVAWLSIEHGLTGPSLSQSATCAASSVAIGEAGRQIQHGYADVMIAGGTETLITYSAINCWNSAQLLAPLHDAPERSCRPFDLTRNGTVLGEGAAFLVLEEWSRALDRGAPILAELAGYACATDSGHVTQPSAEGQARPMRMALADAGLQPSDIGYINAHGTGTKLNDAVETQAIKLVFGDGAAQLPISSPKSMVGHLVGAAGALGTILCVQALQTQSIPPTANLHQRDPECDLDYVAGVGRDVVGLRATMCNAFGFGGTAASLVIAAARP